jgi:SulP family sulfate permease
MTIAASLFDRRTLAGDLWGGLAAALVALPASLAFGVAIYSAIGREHAGQGAVAGIVGAIVIGVAAPLFGGTERLISAPCAPAAAVMAALAGELAAGGADSGRVLLLLTLAALLSGALQLCYGALGGGTLIKYIPYPVVTGYLSGVGVVIFLKQLPGLLGLAGGGPLSQLLAPELWRWPALVVALATIAAMLLAPRFARAVPPPIVGLAAGVAAYVALAAFDARLLTLRDNSLLIGPLGGSASGIGDALQQRLAALPGLRLRDVSLVVSSALTLSVLLSIDTLKTCVVVDALTRTRHDSNREIVGQGLANLASAALGGVPGAGTSGATLVNVASGARTRLSGVACGGFLLLAYLLLGGLVAWAPIAALGGILVVVAFRMFDWGSFRLLRQRATVLDFVVVLSVIATAVGVGLVSASGVGIALSILLFIRDQVRGSVIHRKTYGDRIFSRQKRLAEEVAVLERHGGFTVVCELEGNLFFGTTDKLFTQLEPDLERCRFLVLDMRRIRSVDLTGVHLLQQIEVRLRERGARVLYSGLPRVLPTGQDLKAYFEEVGLLGTRSSAQAFDQLSDALEWVEERVLEGEGRAAPPEETPLDPREMDFLRGRKQQTLEELLGSAELRRCESGARIFKQGDVGDEIFLVRKGRVRIALDFGRGPAYHIATIGRGDFFGEIAFLDSGARSADAVALVPTELLVLSRSRFDAVAAQHPRLGQQFFSSLARALAIRLRQADREIRALEEA